MTALLSWAGLVVAAGTAVEFLLRLATFRAPYSTRAHDTIFAVAGLLAAAGAVGGDLGWRTWVAAAIFVAWFVLTRKELHLARAPLRVEVGAPLPAFTTRTIAGEVRAEDDVVRAAPALLVFFRGKW